MRVDVARGARQDQRGPRRQPERVDRRARFVPPIPLQPDRTSGAQRHGHEAVAESSVRVDMRRDTLAGQVLVHRALEVTVAAAVRAPAHGPDPLSEASKCGGRGLSDGHARLCAVRKAVSVVLHASGQGAVPAPRVDEREQVSLLFLRDRVQNEAYAVALQRRVDGALCWAHATDDVLRRRLQQLGHEAKATRRWTMRQLLGIPNLR